MGVGRAKPCPFPPPHGFSDMIPLTYFSKSTRYVKIIPTLANHLSCLLCWLTLRSRGDWGQV